MRSDMDYHGRLKSRAQFGWSQATRNPRVQSFLVQMTAPVDLLVVLAVSPDVTRLLHPFTEEVVTEWDFSQLTSYSLAPGGKIDLYATLHPAGNKQRFGKYKEPVHRYTF